MASSDMTIDNLQIEIETNAQKATSGIDKLADSLQKLQTAVGGASGLASNLTQIATAIKTFSGVGKINLTAKINQLSKFKEIIPILSGSDAAQFANNLREISSALVTFSTVPKFTVNVGSLASGIQTLNNATASFDPARLAQFSMQMQGIANGLSNLSNVGKTNISSIVSAIKKIPEITQSLDTATIDAFADKVRRLTEVMTPLGVQMDAVARGFNALPNAVKIALRAQNQAVNSNSKLSKSYSDLSTSLSRTAAQFWTLYYSMQRIIDVFADAFNTSNEFIENLNLFRVTMGDSTDAAYEFATTVNDLMGIDIAEWISNQGVFQRMATGFSISAEQADIMSQNLTQLAYDMSSFFNTDVETAMQKLQSGMSGQIKGLKAWGYNLSVAALQETALSLGIEQSVRTMTEAQKAQLRYITLIQKSSGVMGDMARTINTPANAMRILRAQLTQLERAFGNIVSIIATKVIPYVQAFVELAAEAADALADLWGFELPEIDYSNLELASDVMDDIDDSIANTEKEISKLKKQLMGFDELNILKSNDNENKDSDEISYDLGFKMPEYDFLEGLSTEYREEIDKIKEEIKSFVDDLTSFAPVLASIAGMFAFNWVVGAVKKFAKLKPIAAIITAVLGAFENGQLIFEGTGSILKALGGTFSSVWKSFKNFMSGLSPITKGLVSIIALATEFSVVKDAVYDFEMGTKSLGDMLWSVIPVCGAVGVAMYAMLGPVGLVATAVVGLVGALAGYVKAEEEMRAKLVSDTFYDDQGVKIGELAGAYGDLMQKVIDAKQPILDAAGAIDNTRDSATLTAQEVKNIATQFELGYIKIEEYVPLIKEQFDKLYEDTLSILDKESKLIYTALAGSSGKALEDMGYNLTEIGLMLDATVNKTTVEVERMKNELDALNKKAVLGTLTDEEAKKMSELTLNLTEVAGVDTSKLEKFKDVLVDLFPKDIDWKTDDLTKKLEEISKATEEATTAVKNSYDVVIEATEHLKGLETDPEAVKKYSELLSGFKKAQEKELGEIKSFASDFVGNLQTNLIKSVEEQYNTALENWDKMSWFKRITSYGGNEARYVKEFLGDYKENIVKPITDEMKTAFSKSLGEDAVWADTAMTELLNNLFDIEYGDPQGLTKFDTFATDISEAINSVLPGAMKQSGINAVTGFKEGVEAKIPLAEDAAYKMALDSLKYVDRGLDSHSPSRETEKRGYWFDQGLAIGIKRNGGVVLSALDTLISDLKTKVDSFVSYTQNAFSGLNANLSLNGDISFSPFKAYASGGFPSMGEMFIARERGPELVGRIGSKNAVANNNQIITGIATAVYNAMMAAHEDGASGSGGTISRIVVQIGERVIGETAVEYINGQIVQTGVNPIHG